MIRINQLKLQIPHTEEALEKKIQKTLHLKKGDSFTYRIHRQSLDARRKPELFYVYPLEVVEAGPLKFVSVKYHREIPLGSQVEVFYAPSADGWYVVGRREEHAAFECYLEFTK